MLLADAQFRLIPILKIYSLCFQPRMEDVLGIAYDALPACRDEDAGAEALNGEKAAAGNHGRGAATSKERWRGASRG